ncbi:ABC transporter ATP-binding protein [Holospora undulata]|uniref:Putative ABC transporter ATP-binding protein n=1 Tax=Holospora undulata HU1 TaxID=1321371 RepID=A0A061JIV0_9PROT|nr:ABC transporter ATP-binding protein [Holospora undulata]ETZ05199.1 putative ABC transporter ATP-binding protein [Holospora undulata HU1]
MSNKKISVFFYEISRPFWKQIIALSFLSLAWAAIVTLQPALVKSIIDIVTHAKNMPYTETLTKLMVFYLLLGLGFCWINFGYDTTIARFFPAQREYIALKLMQRMMQKPLQFYQKHFSGNLTNKINDVVTFVPNIIEIFVDNFLTCFFTLVFSMYSVAKVHPHFAWALLCWLIIFLGGSLSFLFSKSHLAHRAAESRSRVVGKIVDVFSNIASVQLFFRHILELSLIRQYTNAALQKEQDRDYFFRILHAFQSLSFVFFEGLCFWWLWKGIKSGEISAGEFVLVLTLNVQILDQFWTLGAEIREFWEKLGALKQALSIVYCESQVLELTSLPPHLSVSTGEIVFQRVNFSYDRHSKAPLFSDFNLHIPGGQKVGIVGFSGSGKSTFINLLLRIQDVQKGQVCVDGQDIKNVNLCSLRQAISVIPQECILFNRSVLDNILYGRPESTFEEVQEAAKKSQIHEVIQALPQGYDTIVGERGSRLSGGQRQRIAIARAILKDAPILILDEPTSSLDGITEEELQKAFSEVMHGKTVLFIAHRLNTLLSMERLLVFSAGKIVQDGTHDSLILQKNGMYRKLWSLQMRGLKEE